MFKFHIKPWVAYLSLGVVEVGWYCDHSILHFGSQVALCNTNKYQLMLTYASLKLCDTSEILDENCHFLSAATLRSTIEHFVTLLYD